MLKTTDPAAAVDVALERRLKRLGLRGNEDDWTDRYLLCEHVVDPPTARPRQQFEAIARFIRDLIAAPLGEDAADARAGEPEARSTTCRWSFCSAARCTTTS